LTGFDLDVETAKDANVRTSRVAEVDVLESNVTLRLGEVELFTRRIFSIDLGTRVDEGDEGGCSSSSFRHVGNKGEDVSSLDGTEYDTVVASEKSA
jgi:hypothetical protein